MKKLILAAMMLVLPLTACSSGNSSYGGMHRKVAAENSVYLVLTRNGLYEGAKGESFNELYLENTIKISGEVGTALPGKDKVTNTVNGVEFDGWISYEGNGTPNKTTAIPYAANKILYASWAYTGQGGGGGGGGELPASEWYVVGEGSFLSGETKWSTSTGVNLKDNTANTEDASATGEYFATITFAENDIFKVTNGTVWVQMNALDPKCKPYSEEAIEFVNDNKGGYNAKVNMAGAYDIYFKTYPSANPQGTDGYSLWIEYHK